MWSVFIIVYVTQPLLTLSQLRGYYIHPEYSHDGLNVEIKKPLRSARPPAPLESITPAVFHIMLALAQGPRHGYALMPEVEKLTSGKVRLGPGTLYRSIQRMLVDRLIEELDYPYDVTSDDERRRYYRLTKFGKQVAKAEAERLADLVREASERGLLPGTAAKAPRTRRSRRRD